MKKTKRSYLCKEDVNIERKNEMIEAPEARILCRQLNETVRGKKITDVYTQFSPHKFAWFTGSSEEYAEQLSGKTIPGLGNGVLQDILYHTHIHPKKKISGLTDKERENLFYQIKETMNDIYHLGGRSTESDLFGANGKYVACLSKDTAGMACPRCGETIAKENYQGGSIYYCRGCQPLPPAKRRNKVSSLRRDRVRLKVYLLN